MVQMLTEEKGGNERTGAAERSHITWLWRMLIPRKHVDNVNESLDSVNSPCHILLAVSIKYKPLEIYDIAV